MSPTLTRFSLTRVGQDFGAALQPLDGVRPARVRLGNILFRFRNPSHNRMKRFEKPASSALASSCKPFISQLRMPATHCQPDNLASYPTQHPRDFAGAPRCRLIGMRPPTLTGKDGIASSSAYFWVDMRPICIYRVAIQMKYLNQIANVFVIIGISVFLLIVVQRQLAKPRALASAATTAALKGTTLHVPGLEFPRPRASVLLVISTTCHFCEESLPFYRKLSDAAQGKADLLAVLPQPQSEAAAYLSTAHVPVAQVASLPPAQLGIAGTPTLLLLDRSGKVQDIWQGLLDDSRQAQVQARLGQL